MHQVDLSFTKEVTKVEGSATLTVSVKNGKVEACHFGITEFKRFYTQAMRGKAMKALPSLLARICGKNIIFFNFLPGVFLGYMG